MGRTHSCMICIRNEERGRGSTRLLKAAYPKTTRTSEPLLSVVLHCTIAALTDKTYSYFILRVLGFDSDFPEIASDACNHLLLKEISPVSAATLFNHRPIRLHESCDGAKKSSSFA